jgi:SAM-dependent methyltransferase
MTSPSEMTSPAAMSKPAADPPLAPRARLRWSVVSRLVAGLAPQSILELGCGLGGVGVRLARIARYTAVEPDEQSWMVAQGRIAPVGGEVIHGDHHKAPTDRQYDLVCAFEVLEHIADDAAALADWLPLVRPGGHLLLSVPSDPQRFGPWDTLVGHYRRYSAAELAQRLDEAGATEVVLRHYAWPLGYLLDGVRDRMARGRVGSAAGSAEERTSSSGRLLQPNSPLAAAVTRVGVAPFVLLQSLRPGTGPGLIAVAQRPAS